MTIEISVSRKELLAEFLGSMFLVTTAISGVILFSVVLGSSENIALLANAISISFLLCALVEMFSPVSGAHFNPLVTMVMAFEKRIKPRDSILYILCQIAGGIAGTLLSRLLFLNEVGSPMAIADNARSISAYPSEIFTTFILVFVILTLVKTGSNKISIVVGLLIGSQILATPSRMIANPQVAIARIFTNSPAGIGPLDAVIFIGMQFIGALLAYALYRFMFSKKS